MSALYAYTGIRPFKAEQPTVVFLHGAANDHSVFGLQSRYFAHHGFNVFAFDWPGHGKSAGPLRESIEGLADALFAELEARSLATVAVVGHSMGSLAALEFTHRYPARVTRLALLGTALPMTVGPALLDAAREAPDIAIAMITQWGLAPRAHVGGNQTPGHWMAGISGALMARAAPGVLANDLVACNAYQGGAAAAASVQCPTVVVMGERDSMTPPKAAQALVKVCPRARAVSLENCGHGMMSEAPDAVLAVLRDFLEPLKSQMST